MDKKAPTNTGHDPHGVSAMLLLAEAMVVGGGRAIERQEERGQSSFVQSETLPTDISVEDLATLALFGVKFLGPVEGDALFQYVELPKGWSKRATDHSMWSDLVDDKGRKRAAIFYKAAFYDRGAHLSLTTRFTHRPDYGRESAREVRVHQVFDGDDVIFETEPRKLPKERSWEVCDAAKDEAIAWLNERWPNWKSPAAYWEE